MKKILAMLLCITMVASAAIFGSCSNNKNLPGSLPTADDTDKRTPAENVDVSPDDNDEPNDKIPVKPVEKNDREEDDKADDAQMVMSTIANRKVNISFVENVKEKLAADKEAVAVIQEARNIESDNSITGDWRCVYMDLSPYLEQSFAEDGYDADFSEFNVAILLAITEDKMVMTLDMDSIETDFYELGEEIIDFLGEMIIEELEVNNYTLEEFEAEMGMSLEYFLDEAESMFMTEVASTVENVASSYEAEVLEYEISGDTMVFGDGTVNTFELDGDTLTIYGNNSEPDIVFTKYSNSNDYASGIEGTWNTTIDMSSVMGEIFVMMIGTELEVSSLDIPVVVEITSDTMSLTIASPDDAASKMKVFLESFLDDNIDELIEFSAEESGVSTEDMLAAMEVQGITKADFADMMKEQVIGSMDFDEVIDSMNSSMSYEVEGNVISFEDGSTVEYELNGDNLELFNAMMNGEEMESFGMYPMYLTRA